MSTATTTTASTRAPKMRRSVERRPGDPRPSPTRAVLGMILRIVLSLVFGLPLVFMIVSSFKPDLQSGVFATPADDVEESLVLVELPATGLGP